MSKAKNPKAPAAEGQVQARVLTGCSYGNADDVVTLDPAEAEAGVANGVLDTDPSAVDYAMSLQAE